MTVFCSDIDGTLLNTGRTLSARTIAAIRRTADAGHSFVLCSSRMPASMRLLEGLYGGGAVPLIAYNGGIVLRGNGSVALDERIRPDDAVAVHDLCAELGVHGSFFSGDDWFVSAHDRWAEREAANTGVAPSTESAVAYRASGRILTAPPHKIMCMGEPAAVDRVERMLASHPGLVGYRSKATYLEIASAACSKGDGLAVAAAELGADPADCVFFGDNVNDLSAFAVVGTAVAVANAKPAVLAAATVVTARHHDDGVAAYLEAFLATATGHADT